MMPKDKKLKIITNRILQLNTEIAKGRKERAAMWSGDIAYKMSMAHERGLIIEQAELVKLNIDIELCD